MVKKYLVSLILFLFFVLQHSLGAIVVLEHGDRSLPIGSSLEILEDTSGLLTIKDLLTKENLARFKPSKNRNPSFGISTSAYWVHFKVKNNLPDRDRWLIQGPSIMDKMDVYFTDDNRHFIARKGGGLTPVEQRDYHNRKLLFSIPFDELLPSFDVFIRFESQRQMAFPITLWNEENFSDSDRMEMYVLGIYFGILLVMIFYNIFLLFSLQSKSYLYYVLYITCFGLAQFFEHGFAVEFFGAWIAPYSKHIHLFINTLTLIVAINFSRKFLLSKKQAPRLDKILVGLMSLSGFVLLFILFDKVSWALRLGNPLIVASIIAVLTLSFVCLKNGYRPVRYFLIGWFALMCGIVLYILKTLGVAPYNFFTVYGMQIASAVEVVLFSLALADRINEIQREKDQLKDLLNRELEVKVVERTQEIVMQKEIIEQKNKDITDSINYAQRIQQAILPVKEEIHKTLPDSFVLYKPRDIVSGDFYWFADLNALSGRPDNHPHLMIAAADCTGHGVPGAFMSMIGASQLHKIVNEKGITAPGQILNELNEGVRQALKQDKTDTESRDGMDIALCSITYCKGDSAKVAVLQYAGAFRPLYLVRGGVLQEIKADKFPIGGLQNDVPKSFTNHSLQLLKGDTIYIFTDGYIDQFGGPDGRKYMTKRFKEELITLQESSMPEQERRLNIYIDDWMRGGEQVDDILVIGIRF